MANFPGPYEVRLVYTCNANTTVVLNHSLRFSCDVTGTPAVGTGFDTIAVKNRINSLNPFLDDAIDDFVLLFKAILHTSSTIVGAELWKYDVGTYDATFISAYPINVVGTSATSSANSRQDMVTFRTDAGGVMRFNVLEAGQTLASGVYAPLGGSAEMDAIVNFFLSDDCWMIGRDNGYPFYALRLLVGQNEAVFKKRNR